MLSKTAIVAAASVGTGIAFWVMGKSASDDSLDVQAPTEVRCEGYCSGITEVLTHESLCSLSNSFSGLF